MPDSFWTLGKMFVLVMFEPSVNEVGEMRVGRKAKKGKKGKKGKKDWVECGRGIRGGSVQ